MTPSDEPISMAARALDRLSGVVERLGAAAVRLDHVRDQQETLRVQHANLRGRVGTALEEIDEIVAALDLVEDAT
ncbi:hypothetical protein RM533_12105 [Croceicoccus sp. F390]|uniref:DUF4164 family protein n=1 Tax=Croceicoccus esteveae TaxID=3075597 RepID=A0ABU2ZJY8_9SPHN|nr:hypothetical protein [Croceicoccus sp. F390]MDT0576913.1 hypothetical protein [Croceicoccus sp. F390]